jgi:hypothetical protein
MGTVIPFPDAWRFPARRSIGASVEPATITILPVVRIERHEGDSSDGPGPDAGTASGRRRRRRATRS